MVQRNCALVLAAEEGHTEVVVKLASRGCDRLQVPLSDTICPSHVFLGHIHRLFYMHRLLLCIIIELKEAPLQKPYLDGSWTGTGRSMTACLLQCDVLMSSS